MILTIMAYFGCTLWILGSLLSGFAPTGLAMPLGSGSGSNGGYQNVSFADSSKNVFQVAYPKPSKYGDSVASQQLLKHTFGNSWGSPYTTDYRPPSEDFTHVALTISGSVDGNQFDRLGHILLGDVEVWRPSTPEPGGETVTWGITKDVSAYASLFKKSQKVAYVLNNVIDDTYTGKFDITVDVDFFNIKEDNPDKNNVKEAYKSSRAADTVQPLVPADHKPGHIYKSPKENLEVSAKVDKSTYKAVLDVFASGDGDEEFWYTHLMDEYSNKFKSDVNDLGGKGPVRQVDVYIDETFAGYAHPYPVVYTGGMSPAFWSPIVSINAYEVPSYQIDLTPFLSKLYNGCKVKVRMSNLVDDDSDKATDSQWLITASLMSWTIDGLSGQATAPNTQHSPQQQHRGYLSNGDKRLSQVVVSSQSVQNSAKLEFGDQSFTYKWSQSGNQANIQGVDKGGTDQSAAQAEKGENLATLDGDQQVSKFSYEYYLTASTLYIGDNNDNGYNMSLAIGYKTETLDTKVDTSQFAKSYSKINGHDFQGGDGSTEQRYSSNVYGDAYARHVMAENRNVKFDNDNDDSSNPRLKPQVQKIQDAADNLLKSGSADDSWKQGQNLFVDLLGERDSIAHTDHKMFASLTKPHWFVRNPFIKNSL